MPVPPMAVRREARLGLELRREFGRGGTAVGVARARDLSNGRNVSERTLARMRSYFARHAVDARARGWEDEDNPSAGWIAWLLWGGDAGRAWVERELKRENPAARSPFSATVEAYKKRGWQIALHGTNNEWHLGALVLPKTERSQGAGSAFMHDIVRIADAYGITLTLNPSTHFGGSSEARLRGFYKRFGFVDNKGRNKDWEIGAAMYRHPQTKRRRNPPRYEDVELLRTASIMPPHEVRDFVKLTGLVESMDEGGWQGRPLLVAEHGDGYVAWTGSHRLAAAADAGLDHVPAVVIPEADVEAMIEAGLVDDRYHTPNDMGELADLVELASTPDVRRLLEAEE